MSFFNTMQNLVASENEVQNPDSLAPRTQAEESRLITDQNGHIIFANGGFEELAGNIEIVIGDHITDIFSFDESEQEMPEGRHTFTLINSDQELSLQCNWIESQNGQKYFIISAEEITAGKKLLQYVTDKVEEKKTIDSDQAPFLDLTFDACFISTLNGKFITVNGNFSKLFGYSIEELSDKSITDLTRSNSRDAFLETLKTLAHKEIEQHAIKIESCCMHKDGTPVWVEWSHKRIENRIYSTARDLTPLKSYRDSLLQQEKKLSEAEAIGHIGQWRWPVGSDNIEFSNQLFKIFGLEEKTFSPTLNNINSMIHRQDSGRMMQVFQRAIIEQNDYDMDFRITRPDGEIRFIKCEGRCESDIDDDVMALYGIMQDITETTRREIDLRQAKESVERAYAAKSRFLANMSHELRTPLNAVIGFSEMMERQLLGPIGTEKYLEYISGIRQSGEHLLDLISDILDMSKIEAGKYDLNVEQFNIAKVIRMAVHMMEGRAVDSEIKMNIDIQNEELNVVADRRAVMQMILNLLSNAVKFSKHGKTINIRLVERDELYSIHIEDEGIGIPANKLANITMPFEQAETDYTREYEGSGLGLSITKELAEIHGGSLSIESTLNVGTKVIIRLPYKAHS